MDRTAEYSALIQRVLNEYVELDRRCRRDSVETLMIADETRNHYILLGLGWSTEERSLYIRIYVRLIDGKFWIEDDWTEEGVATDLLAAGVPHSDIVLGFQPPEMRPFTEFAAA